MLESIFGTVASPMIFLGLIALSIVLVLAIRSGLKSR